MNSSILSVETYSQERSPTLILHRISECLQLALPTMKSSKPLISTYCTPEQTSTCILLVKDVSEMQQSKPGYNDNDLYDTSTITSNILWFNTLVNIFTLELYAKFTILVKFSLTKF